MLQVLDFAFSVPGGDAVKDVAAPGQTGDFVEGSRMDGHPAEPNGGVLGKNIGRRLAILKGDNHIARGEDVGNPRAGKAQRVMDEVALAPGKGAFTGALFGEENDFAVGGTIVRFAPDDGADNKVAEVGQWTEQAAHPIERVGGVLLQVGAINDTEVFRNDLRNNQNAEGHHGGDQAQ